MNPTPPNIDEVEKDTFDLPPAAQGEPAVSIDYATGDVALAYGWQRLEALGLATIDPATGNAKVHPDFTGLDDNDGDAEKGTATPPLFAVKADTGDLLIRYLNLDGSVVLRKNGSKWQRYLEVVRLAQPKGSMKYAYPTGEASRLYLTPRVVRAYQAKQEIETLWLTEGQLKAAAGDLHGLHIIGLGGIHSFLDKAGSLDSKKLESHHKRLFKELVDVIRVCKVQRVAMLYDADLLDIAYSEDKDLANRPKGFWSSIRNLSYAMREFREQTALYMAYIRADQPGNPKGLDDLLLSRPAEQRDEICAEINRLSNAGRYVGVEPANDNEVQRLRRFFHISSAQHFYDFHSKIIGERPFIYEGTTYKINHDKGELETIKLAETVNYLRVGTQWFKEIAKPDAYGSIEKELIQWSTVCLAQDYGEQKAKQIVKEARRYNAFVLVPCNDEGYMPEVEGCYNLYHPLEHEPAPGPWNTIYNFFRHLAHNEYQQKLDVLLDVYYLMYVRPLQKLPIVCLVSEERETGKSTVLHLNRRLFGRNATLIGNEDISDNYNDNFITKKVIGIDEVLLNESKRGVLEKIKSLSTSPKANMHAKFVARQEVDFFGTFFLTSNNVRNFLPIDSEETRFLVLKVPRIQQRDPNLLAKMESEIPAFLYYLKHEHKLAYPTAITRLWFPDEALKTEALATVQAGSGSGVLRDLRAKLAELFLTHVAELKQVMNGPRLRYTVGDLKLLLDPKNPERVGHDYLVNTVLGQHLKLEVKANSAYRLPPHEVGHEWRREKGRYYEFTPEHVFTAKADLQRFYDLYEGRATEAETEPAPHTTPETDLPF